MKKEKMMRQTTFTPLAILVGMAMLLFSCSKGHNEPEDTYTNNTYASAIAIHDNGDVHVVGVERHGTETIAKYWKNGTVVNLIKGDVYSSSATDITIYNGDVYISGEEYFGGSMGGIAKYWNLPAGQVGNGTEVNLTNGPKHAVANAITVHNGDIYVGGREHTDDRFSYVPKYWKNGIGVTFDNDDTFLDISGIAIHNEDVYLSGLSFSESGGGAKYWKNNEEITLITDKYSWANDIAVHNGDVYVVGGEYDQTSGTARYWINNTPVDLTEGALEAVATSITINNGDIYIAGYERRESKKVAKYWNLPAGQVGNGTAVNLTNGRHDATATDIAIHNGDIYVSGYEHNGSRDVAKYWKNGTAVTLSR